MTIQLTGQLLRSCETACVLGISENQVRNLRRSGQLPMVRVGNSIRYRREDVIELARKRNS